MVSSAQGHPVLGNDDLQEAFSTALRTVCDRAVLPWPAARSGTSIACAWLPQNVWRPQMRNRMLISPAIAQTASW